MSRQSAILRAIEPDVPRRRTFCGYCGHRPDVEDEGGRESQSRVCTECELGLLLTADEALSPASADAFLVVDAGLSIRALSQAAEKLFAITETDVVDQPLENVLVPAESSDDARGKLNRLLSSAAHEPLSAREPDVAVVRPAREFGVRYRARVGRCEPGRAALVVLNKL
jgi:hypothetical protein